VNNLKNFYDVDGNLLEEGDIVEWDDAEGTRTAEVILQPAFRCIDNKPNKKNWAVGHTFCLETFMYRETEKHIKIIKKGDD
jgi:hypothetical protein